jgi:hypothetical protein
MARTRKPRPSFEVPFTPADGGATAAGWVYKTDADAPAPPRPAKASNPPSTNSLVSELSNVILLPVAISLVAVLVPLSWLTDRWRR